MRTKTYLDQNERDRNESDRDESQRRTSPIDTQFRVHSIGEEREPSAESRAHEIVSGQDRSRILRVSVRQVVENTVEQ